MTVLKDRVHYFPIAVSTGTLVGIGLWKLIMGSHILVALVRADSLWTSSRVLLQATNLVSALVLLVAGFGFAFRREWGRRLAVFIAPIVAAIELVGIVAAHINGHGESLGEVSAGAIVVGLLVLAGYIPLLPASRAHTVKA